MPPGHGASGFDSPASGSATDAGNSDPSTAAPLPYHRRPLRRSRGGVVRPARHRPRCELRESRSRGLVDDPVVATADDRHGQGRPAVGVPARDHVSGRGVGPIQARFVDAALHAHAVRRAAVVESNRPNDRPSTPPNPSATDVLARKTAPRRSRVTLPAAARLPFSARICWNRPLDGRVRVCRVH